MNPQRVARRRTELDKVVKGVFGAVEGVDGVPVRSHGIVGRRLVDQWENRGEIDGRMGPGRAGRNAARTSLARTNRRNRPLVW